MGSEASDTCRGFEQCAEPCRPGRDEARAIGDEINAAKGFDPMREVAHRTLDLGRRQPFAPGYVERWWNGIGGWMS
ncbi:MAG: hypothetical protein R6V62_11040 [Candidatus Fermentibacteraceae bacterium]